MHVICCQFLFISFRISTPGEEVTPDTCTACRENQQHVTADIAFAARQYVAATRDMDWLRNDDGCEFIIDMAKFWVSRAEYDSGIDRYHIRGRDEFSYFVLFFHPILDCKHICFAQQAFSFLNYGI